MKIGTIKEYLSIILSTAVFVGLSRLIYLHPPIFEGMFELRIVNAMYIAVFMVAIPGVVAYYFYKYLNQILAGDDDSKFKF